MRFAGLLLFFFFFPIAPVESKPVSPAPDGGRISAGVARGLGSVVLKRCTFRGSVSEGWNGDGPGDCASASTAKWTNAAASAASARAGC